MSVKGWEIREHAERNRINYTQALYELCALQKETMDTRERLLGDCRELLIGCGNSRLRRVRMPGDWYDRALPGSHMHDGYWRNLTTLDHDAACKPDVLHDLEVTPYPFDANTFDEVHAYEVLEHIGHQGDYLALFAQFGELWRILKPQGLLYASCPSWNSLWAWGDPGHRRVINEGTLVFLSQREYRKQIGKTTMTDYRAHWRGDFEVAMIAHEKDGTFKFVLRAEK